MKPISLLASTFATFCMLGHSALAHEINTSYTSIELRNGELITRFTFDQADIARIFEFDENEDGEVTKDEFLINMSSLFSYVEDHVTFNTSGEKVILVRGEGLVYDDELGNDFIDINFKNSLSAPIWKLTVDLDIFMDFGFRHKILAKIVSGDEVQQSIFTAGYQEQSFTFSGDGVSVFDQILQFSQLGLEHILVGYDHLLFLLGLILIGGNFLNLIKIVSSFTVAHSITLILAALGVVLLPARLIESVIALSIIYIAVENFFVKDTDQRWLITFAFGLMHGFGFAGVLRELGLPSKGLVISLLAFNVGIELGQLVIVALMFPILYAVQKSRWQKQIVYGISSAILVFGLVWFIERAFDFTL